MNKLKEFREEKKLTQTELAAKSGISQRYIAFIESGDRTPSLNSALRIAEVLGRSVEEIFFLPNKCTNST
nr:MAG TPA: Helix-turn-helix XRE-family like protein [Bacteriophage sp.]